MTILGLEFSAPQHSVAVLLPAGTFTEVTETTHRNTMQPLAMVEEALRQAGREREQVDCLAVGLGPGSYTGIRAAISLAQGWQLAREVRLLGVSTGEAIAVGAAAEGLAGSVGVVIDAQRGEFYLAGYELTDGSARLVTPLRLASKAEVQACADAGATLIGPEVTKWFPAGRLVLPRAVTIARLAATRTDFLPGEKLEPIYLRETTFVKAPPPRDIPPIAVSGAAA